MPHFEQPKQPVYLTETQRRAFQHISPDVHHKLHQHVQYAIQHGIGITVIGRNSRVLDSILYNQLVIISSDVLPDEQIIFCHNTCLDCAIYTVSHETNEIVDLCEVMNQQGSQDNG